MFSMGIWPFGLGTKGKRDENVCMLIGNHSSMFDYFSAGHLFQPSMVISVDTDSSIVTNTLGKAGISIFVKRGEKDSRDKCL